MVTKGKKQGEAVQGAERPPAPTFSTSLLPRMSSPGHKWTDFLSFTLSFAGEPGGPGPNVATCSGTGNFIRKNTMGMSPRKATVISEEQLWEGW